MEQPLAPSLELIPELERGCSQTQLQRVRYTHDAMIDMIVAHPDMSQNDLADLFGYSVSWISTVLNSESFQARLAKRRSLIVGNSLLMTFNERMRKLAGKSMDILEKKLDQALEAQEEVDPAIAMDILKIAAKGYGFGGGAQSVNINNTINAQQTNNVVMVPAKANSAKDWAAAYGAEEGGLEAGLANSEKICVPPLPPALEAMCVTEPMDTTPAIVPVGQPVIGK